MPLAVVNTKNLGLAANELVQVILDEREYVRRHRYRPLARFRLRRPYNLLTALEFLKLLRDPYSTVGEVDNSSC